tara:strand:- start:3847 stop:5949 length:2103 start_codon:yes stop_codon:yes gene_type:complete
MSDNFLQPPDDTIASVDEPQEELSGIVGYIKDKFQSAEDGRYTHEQRWLKAYKNFRGIYDTSTQYRDSERSRVFLRITKTKVLAAFGQITDILFANKKFPIVVEPTPVPEGIAEFAHMQTPLDQMQQPLDPYGFPGDGRNVQPGAMDFLGGLQEKYEGTPIAEGPAKIGEPQISPAQEAALNMEKEIHDQLTDTGAVNVLRNAIFEQILLGTGIIKGPMLKSKRLHKWTRDDNGQRAYTPEEMICPEIEAVSCWDFFPDPSAVKSEDCEYVVQRHRMNRQQLRNLAKYPYFNIEAIDNVIAKGPNYEDKYYEDTIRDDESEPNYNRNRFEVLEYWGVMDRSFLDGAKGLIDQDITNMDQLQVNVWVSGTEIIRFVLNPFTPARIPFHVFPYELNPYQIFGTGVPENMEDAQLLMNGHMRMAIDNLALAGNLVFDVDEASLVPGQNMDIFPGKIFRRQSGVTGTAINGLKFPNTAPENIQMYQLSRQLADEETGIPSILHGQTGVTGTGRTAAGLSMLMGGANLSLKTVIKNIDDFLLKPLGEAYFQWNMQFNDDSPDIVGDLEIKPRGTAAVMQKEVRSQRLTALLQTVSNPMLAPFVKIPNLIRELAIAQDIDPDSLVNDENQAKIFAEILRGLNELQQAQTPDQQPNSMAGSGGVDKAPTGLGLQGDGSGDIGVGTSPVAGESSFTGNTSVPEGQQQG